MTKTSGKKLNLLKSLEILQSNSFVSFYHFNNLSKREWDEIKLKLKEIKRVAWNLKSLLNKTCQADKAATTQPVQRDPRTCALQPLSQGEREPSEVRVLVLKSKAVVKLLAPLLLATNNQRGVEETTGLAPYCATLPPVARHVQRAVATHRLLPVQREPHSNNLTQGEQETAFKDRVTSLTKALSLIEGPTLLIGASTVEGFKESAKRLEREKGLVFVGGVLGNQFINHLDLKDCLKRDLLSPAHLVQTLRLSLVIPPLAYYSNKLLFLLQRRQESLRDC